MITVELEPAAVVLAGAWQIQVLERLPPRPNHTGLQVQDRYLVGYVGELAVHRWLEDEQIAYEYDVNLTGTSAPSEFVVVADEGRPLRLEVKTASRPEYERMMITRAQRLDAEIFVSARILDLWPCVVALDGWATRREVERWPIWTFGRSLPPTRWRFLSELRDMRRLANALLRRPAGGLGNRRMIRADERQHRPLDRYAQRA